MEAILAITIVLLLAGFGVLWSRQKDRLRELRRSYRRIEVEEGRIFDFLHGLGEALYVDTTASKLHRIIVDGVVDVLQTEGGAMFLLNKEETRLMPNFLSRDCPILSEVPARVIEQARENPTALQSHVRLQSLPADSGILGACLEKNEALNLSDISRHPGLAGMNPELHSGVAAMLSPLTYGSRSLGVLAVAKRQPGGAFSLNEFDVFRSIAEQASFALGNALAHHSAADRRRLESELKMASEIQKILLPSKSPEFDGFRIRGINIPARYVSGDYFDYIAVDDQNQGVLIADVSGKGIPASLIMAVCRGVLRSWVRSELSPSAVLKTVNRLIFPDIVEDMFITMAYAILNSRSGEVRMARAGHDPPIHFDSKSGELRTLEPAGMAVGIDSGDVFDRVLADFSLVMSPGDCLLLYTDGVNEALDDQGNEFGIERIHEAVLHAAGEGAEAVVDRITGDIRAFIGDRPQHDDITLIAIERL